MFFGSKKKHNGAADDAGGEMSGQRSKPVPLSDKLERIPEPEPGASASKSPEPAGDAPPLPDRSVAESAAGPATAQEADPETLAKIAELRARLHETFGKVALAMMTVPRYRHLPFGDMSALILDPLIRDRIAIATASKESDPVDGTMSGVAIWASVSEEVDAKIIEQIRAGTFPIRLQASDWNSGDIPWLLDVIAPTQQLTVSVISNFRQVVKGSEMRLHPTVTRLVGQDALEKIGVKPVEAERGGSPMKELV